MESLQITLNTKYGINQDGTYIFKLPQIETQSQHEFLMSVKSAVIPYSFYNVNTYNNYFRFDLYSYQYSIYFTVGNYSIIQFQSYLNTLLLNYGFTTVVYNNITNTFTFSSPHMFQFYGSSTCLQLLGFTPTTTSYGCNNGVLTSNGCINMNSIQMIRVVSNYTSGNVCVEDLNNQNVLCSLAVNSPPFSNIVYINDQTSSFKCNLYQRFINEISIKLTDQDNNLLDLNGLNYSIVLQLDISDFVN